MATYTFVPIDIKEAKALADLTGIKHDFEAAIEFCDILNSHYRAGTYDVGILDAMSSAILVRYSRAFASGLRNRLILDDIPNVTEDDRIKHKYLMDIRNMHIAHPVNTFEENVVVGYYHLENPYEKGITSISVQSGRIVSLSGEDIEKIIYISTKAIGYIETRIKEEQDNLLQLVKEMDLNEILKTNEPIAFNPDTSAPDKNRRQ